MRAKQSYLLLDRIQIVRRKIEEGYFPSITDLIETVLYELGIKVSVNTIYRDLDFMKDRYGINIKYDSVMKGYYIIEKKAELWEQR